MVECGFGKEDQNDQKGVGMVKKELAFLTFGGKDYDDVTFSR